MTTKKSKNNEISIKPLFLMVDDSKNIGNHIISFAKDDYNKAIGAALIDAKNDAEAISSFLLEFRDAPLTLISYSKEIERLLLWCIHIAKLNISSLRRNDLMVYQDFLKNPEPKNVWVGAKVKRQLADGSANPNWRPFGKALGASTRLRIVIFSKIQKNFYFQCVVLFFYVLCVVTRCDIISVVLWINGSQCLSDEKQTKMGQFRSCCSQESVSLEKNIPYHA